MAALEAQRQTPYREVIIDDLDRTNVDLCEKRLREAKVDTVRPYVGKAAEVAAQILPTLNPTGLKLAFLDPFNIESLAVSVIETLAKAKRMDMLIHVSIVDLRNGP